MDGQTLGLKEADEKSTTYYVPPAKQPQCLCLC